MLVFVIYRPDESQGNVSDGAKYSNYHQQMLIDAKHVKFDEPFSSTSSSSNSAVSGTNLLGITIDGKEKIRYDKIALLIIDGVEYKVQTRKGHIYTQSPEYSSIGYLPVTDTAHLLKADMKASTLAIKPIELANNKEIIELKSEIEILKKKIEEYKKETDEGFASVEESVDDLINDIKTVEQEIGNVESKIKSKKRKYVKKQVPSVKKTTDTFDDVPTEIAIKKG